MKRQTGSILIVMLILLVIMSLVSINLFTSSLQAAKNSSDFFIHRKRFYNTEACLWRHKQAIATLTKPLPAKANCYTQRCVNPYQFNLALAKQQTAWWQTHGIACSKPVWFYRELMWHQTGEAIYRISAYHEQHLLLQLYIDKHFTTAQEDSFSWRQIY